MKEDFRSPKRHPWRGSRAFTLVELLVVIVIMSILMTAGAIGLGGLGGKGVTSAVASVESLFDEARSIAIGKRTKTRVMVAKSLTTAATDNLRKVVIAYQELDDKGQPKTPESWVLSSRATVLPDQVFFSQEYSQKNHSGGGGQLDTTSAPANWNKATLGGDYFYYEFNAEGICTTPGASFVVGSGSRGTTGSSLTQKPRVSGAGVKDFGGFVVWRNGSTSMFRSPEQIGIGSLKAGDQF